MIIGLQKIYIVEKTHLGYLLVLSTISALQEMLDL